MTDQAWSLPPLHYIDVPYTLVLDVRSLLVRGTALPEERLAVIDALDIAIRQHEESACDRAHRAYPLVPPPGPRATTPTWNGDPP